MFTSFLPAVSQEALHGMGRQIRQWRMHQWVTEHLAELAAQINPIVAGWMNYYGPVLPVALSSPPAAHQHLPDALGWPEIQTAAVLQERFKPWWLRGSSIENPSCSRTGAGSARSPDCR